MKNMSEITIYYTNTFPFDPSLANDYTLAAQVSLAELHIPESLSELSIEQMTPILEKIFEKFNLHITAQHSSLRTFSVGDVILINSFAFRCDARSWSLIDFNRICLT